MEESRSYAYLTSDVMKNKFDKCWDQKDLWKLAAKKKVKKYKVSDVKHWVYFPCWSEGDCFISIYQVMSQPKRFKDHMKRIKNADLKYPLIIIKDEYDNYGGILDGNHRFAKVIMENKRYVNFVYLTPKELDKIALKGCK